DFNNLFAIIKFYKKALASGIKPIIGAEVILNDKATQTKTSKLLLLCQDDTGYKHLTRLISRAYIEGQESGQPRVSLEWLSAASQGLIAISVAMEGDIAQLLLGKQTSLVKERLAWWQSVFGDRFYLEVTRTNKPEEAEYIQAALTLSAQETV